MRRHGNVWRRLAAVGLTAIMLATQLPAVAFGTEIEETMEQESIESDTAGPEVSELEADEQVASEHEKPEAEEPNASEPEKSEAEEPDASEPEKPEAEEPDASVSVSGNSDGKTVSGDEAADNEAAPDDPADNVSSDAFEESKTLDGVKITVSAESGAFPEGDIHLSVNKAGRTDEEKAETAVEEEREKDVNVAASYTYDIKILDNDGNEIEPSEGAEVKVSFKLEEVADSNLETNIYHIREADPDGTASEENSGNTGSDPEEIGSGESNEESVEGGSEVSDNTDFVAEKLTVETDGDTAVAETDGFSLYTVEFTYESKQYVLPGDSEITLSEILDTVGLAGEVTDVKVSDETLFSASDDSGEWIVTAHKAFDTEEWMKVTIGGVVYEITVTDTNGEQTITYTIDSKAENSRVIYSLVGSDGSSCLLLDSKDARPKRITVDMGEDVTFDIDGDGGIVDCDSVKKEYVSIAGFNNCLNSSTLHITITSKTRTVKHVQIDGWGYVSFNRAKTSMEADGTAKTITVTWEKGEGGNRKGTPGKFIVTFAPPVQTYNIKYELNGGTNSESNPSTYDDDKDLTLADPTRTGYTFAGWYTNSSCTGSPVKNIPVGSSGDKTLYAKWTINEYTITWKNYNGTILGRSIVEYGKTPSYGGEIPTKPSNAQYSYTFKGWSPAIKEVTGNQTYTALFSSTTNKYTVTWKDSDGTTIYTEENVPYGTTPSYSGATPTKASDGKYSYTFKGWSPSITSVTGPATYTAVYTKTPNATHFSQSGDTYTIHDAVGWEIFCECLQDNETYNRFLGKTVVLGDDITVTGMAGSSDNHFCGTFDGKGKTLTVRYDAGEDYAAPFRYADGGCVIENLHVAGTIATSSQFAAGVIGEQYGTVIIRNCRVSVTIESSKSGDGTHGGFVGIKVDSNDARLTIEGCVFDGRIVSAGSTATTDCGGFVGWTKSKGSLTILNSLYAPAADADAVNTGATFARNWTMPGNANCYYTAALGSEQGKRAYSITAGENTTVANAGTVTTYDVSGITSYGTGIKYKNVLYAGAGEKVSLTLGNTTPSGKAFRGYCVTNARGEDITRSALDGTTLTMPTGNVTISAVFETLHTHSFTYSASGATITATCANTDGNCPLTDHKAMITILRPAHETYGDGKAVTASISGDTDVLGTPAISYYKGTTKLNSAPSGAGTYIAKITLGAATASLEYTIAPIAVTVKADNKSKVYDKDTSTDPKLTATVTGALMGDIINYSLSRKAGQNAGNYEITVTLDENPNYAVTAKSGTFSITPKSITVSANNKTKTYDNNASTDPALTATVTGAAAGDAINYSLSRAAGQNVGNYDITVTPGSNPNYTVNVKSGCFSIEKADYPANRPQENIETANQNDKVSKVALPSGWQWSDADKDRGLNVNEPVTVSANYIAADKANYIEDGLVCNVTIKRNPTVNVTKVTLNKTTATIVKGKTLTLTATVAPSNATNKAVTWSSSNTNVATVNSKGVVTAVAPGTANITVTTNDGKKTAVCKVTVTIPVTGVKLNTSSASIVKGKTLTLTAAVAPSNATNKAVTWSSSNTKVATVSTKGVVKAVDGGSAVITVTTADGKKTAKCTVKVIVPVSGVKLNKTKANVPRGYTITLTPTVSPSNATNKAVTWKSSNTKIATVTSKGVVKGIKNGTVNITVTTNDGKKTATCKVTVVNPTPVKSVKLNKTKASVVKGYTITLTPTVSPSNATNKAVTWKSSNTKIATVTSAGEVKGVKAGTANITVTTKDGKKTAVCAVTVTNPIAVKSVKLNAAKVTVAKGKTYTLKATINPTNATNKAVSWKSSNTKIATVTSKGVVKGIAKGSAKITVTTTDGKKTAVCTVTVK